MSTKSLLTIVVAALVLLCGHFSVQAELTGRIAFTSEQNGNADIFSMDVYGNHLTRLTNDIGEDKCPVFSPDGLKIAFFSNRSGTGSLYVMDWDGNNSNVVPNSQSDTSNYVGRWIAWSPDGQKLLYRPTYDSLATINLDGSNKTVLSTGGALGHDFIEGVEWGPTSNAIYLSAHPYSNGYDQHVFRYTISNGVFTQITQETEPLCSHPPQVSTALSRIVFGRNEGWQGPYNIYTMDLDGGNMIKLTFDTGSTFNVCPDWIDDGRWITFSRSTGGVVTDIAIMDATGGNLRVFNLEGNNYTPSWTPIPEPASLALLALGGLAVFRRRRR
jgi:Tol biopolymer transport system component